ncbi:hypothetical protein H0H93_003392 [Arthromyces matolae]|nr:hypothetical protein H0H93_003392 [Arthromyces matolae]
MNIIHSRILISASIISLALLLVSATPIPSFDVGCRSDSNAPLMDNFTMGSTPLSKLQAPSPTKLFTRGFSAAISPRLSRLLTLSKKISTVYAESLPGFKFDSESGGQKNLVTMTDINELKDSISGLTAEDVKDINIQLADGAIPFIKSLVLEWPLNKKPEAITGIKACEAAMIHKHFPRNNACHLRPKWMKELLCGGDSIWATLGLATPSYPKLVASKNLHTQYRSNLKRNMSNVSDSTNTSDRQSSSPRGTGSDVSQTTCQERSSVTPELGASSPSSDSSPRSSGTSTPKWRARNGSTDRSPSRLSSRERLMEKFRQSGSISPTSGKSYAFGSINYGSEEESLEFPLKPAQWGTFDPVYGLRDHQQNAQNPPEKEPMKILVRPRSASMGSADVRSGHSISQDTVTEARKAVQESQDIVRLTAETLSRLDRMTRKVEGNKLDGGNTRDHNAGAQGPSNPRVGLYTVRYTGTAV